MQLKAVYTNKHQSKYAIKQQLLPIILIDKRLHYSIMGIVGIGW